jgi:hypothetical protein
MKLCFVIRTVNTLLNPHVSKMIYSACLGKARYGRDTLSPLNKQGMNIAPSAYFLTHQSVTKIMSFVQTFKLLKIHDFEVSLTLRRVNATTIL